MDPKTHPIFGGTVLYHTHVCNSQIVECNAKCSGSHCLKPLKIALLSTYQPLPGTMEQLAEALAQPDPSEALTEAEGLRD